MRREGFSGRVGLVLAAIGMAVGMGNIWRFPRIVAQYEGGAFLVPWLLFLVTWSIPILIAEFTLGRATRRGPVGAFTKLLGRHTAWMGMFIAFTTLMNGSFYSVVTGWVAKYAVVACTDGFSALPLAEDPEAIRANHETAREQFTAFSEQSIEPVAWHLLVVVLCVLVVLRGVRGGVERLCKVAVPGLFLLLVGGAAWALTQVEGSMEGVEYFFHPKWEHLKSPNIWLDGLSQSAFSTGAGFGLILVYGAWSRPDEDAVVNNTSAAIGNNMASLLAGLFLFPAAFGLLGAAGLQAAEITGALKDSGPANTGFAFQYVPFIFKSVPEVGGIVAALFFVALFLAAISSLVAMYELGTRVLMDFGMRRAPAVWSLGAVCAVLGVPSALNKQWFVSMEWVWTIGLIFSGIFLVWAVQLHGIQPFRALVNRGATWRVGATFEFLFLILIPLQAVAMLSWWLWDAYRSATNPWDPWALGTANVGMPLAWLGGTALLFALVSPWLGRSSLRGSLEEDVAVSSESETRA